MGTMLMNASSGETRKGKNHPVPFRKSGKRKIQTVIPEDAGDYSSDDDVVPKLTPKQGSASKRQRKPPSTKPSKLEMKRDLEILQEMENPKPSTSAPLRREQEKIRQAHPKKFPLMPITPMCANGGQEVSETKPTCLIRLRGKRKSTITPEPQINDVKTPKITRLARRTINKRLKANCASVDNEHKKEQNTLVSMEGQGSQNCRRQRGKPAITKQIHPKATGSDDMALLIPNEIKSASTSSSLTKSPPAKVAVLREKRQRKLSCKLNSKELSGLPPLLYRIGTDNVNKLIENDNSTQEAPEHELSSPVLPRIPLDKENMLTSSSHSKSNGVATRIDRKGERASKKQCLRKNSNIKRRTTRLSSASDNNDVGITTTTTSTNAHTPPDPVSTEGRHKSIKRNSAKHSSNPRQTYATRQTKIENQ